MFSPQLCFLCFLAEEKVLYGLIFPLFVDYLQTVNYPANTKITLRIDGVSWILTHDFLFLAWRETHFFLHVQPINKVWKEIGLFTPRKWRPSACSFKAKFFFHTSPKEMKKGGGFFALFQIPYMQNVSFPACQMMRTTQKKINKVFKEGKGLFYKGGESRLERPC